MAEESAWGTANASLIDPGDGPTFESGWGTAYATLFDPLGPSPVQQSEWGTASATLVPAGADAESPFRAATWNGFAWVEHWFRTATWSGSAWTPVD